MPTGPELPMPDGLGEVLILHRCPQCREPLRHQVGFLDGELTSVWRCRVHGPFAVTDEPTEETDRA